MVTRGTAGDPEHTDAQSADPGLAPLLAGTIAGAGAWIVGYLLTVLAARSTVRADPRTEILESATGETVTLELLAWTYFNAHFVPTEVPQTGLFSMLPREQNVVLDGSLAEALLLAVPPLVLVVAGVAVAVRFRGRLEGAAEYAVAGATIAVGYLLVTIVGVLLSTVVVDGGLFRPSPLEAIVIAGLLYPLVFGALGGLVAGGLPHSDS